MTEHPALSGSAKPAQATARQRIGIFGNFGSSNLGNEGSLEAMMAFLRRARPDAEIVCICSDPAPVRQTYRVPAHPMRVPRMPNASALDRLRARLSDVALTVRTIRGFDALVIPGTGVLDDFGEPPQGLPLTLFSVCLVARLRGIKVGFVSVGAGPIRHPLSRRLMKYAAAMADYCSYRDDISRAFMQSLGVDTNRDRVYPDIAFKLPSPPESQAAGQQRPLTVGVGVMSYYGWASDPGRGADIYQGYLEKITAFVRWLLEQNYRVRLLTGEASDWRAVDDVMAVISAQGERRDSEIAAEPAGSLHDLMAQIAQTDVVVATRFHNVVCALKMVRPTISLGYARKNDVLLEEMGLSAFCQHVESFDLERLKAQLQCLIERREALGGQIRAVNAAYAQKLEEQDANLLRLLL